MLGTGTKLLKLSRLTDAEAGAILGRVLFVDETIGVAFTETTVAVAFTNRRVLVSIGFGLANKKRDITSIAYQHISAVSVETNETKDEVAAVAIVTRALGILTFELRTPISIDDFNAHIGRFIA